MKFNNNQKSIDELNNDFEKASRNVRIALYFAVPTSIIFFIYNFLLALEKTFNLNLFNY